MALRVLVLDLACPHPATDGGRLRRLGLLRGLAERNKITLACPVFPGKDDSTELERIGVTVVPWAESAKPSRPKAMLTGRPRCLVPGNVDTPPPVPPLQGFDVAYGSLSVAPALRATGLPWVLDDVNVETDLFRQHFRHERLGVLKVKRGLDCAEVWAYERRWLRRADHVVCCSEPDRRALAGFAPSVPVTVVPNGIDPFALDFALTPRQPGLIVYVGGLDYAPNADAARFLVEHVMPELRRRCSGVRLRIIGRSPDRTLLAARAEDVEVTGAVTDVGPHLREAALTVIPLRTGGGTRLKVLEAMAAGVPIVATPLAVQGIPLRDGVDARIGARGELARLAAETLEDEASRLGLARAAREHVVASGTAARSALLLDEVLRAVVSRTALRTSARDAR